MKFEGGFQDEDSTSPRSKVVRRSRAFCAITVCFILYVITIVVGLNLQSDNLEILVTRES